jgi:hypothetical protein
VIFDRTQNDVDTAIRLRDTKVKSFEELTESDIKYLEKGTLTINTLNRIENKQEELKNLFNSMGYWNTPIKNKVWDYTQIFNVDEFQRILDNTNVLREAFFVYKGTPNTPPISYHWQDINALEKILYDLDVMISNVKSNYRFCGDFECGEMI